MKRLLIIGAGGHGKVVKEAAEAIGGYEKIDFVDDNSVEAVGKIKDLEWLYEEYDLAFVGIGDCCLRKGLIQKLISIGYKVPALLHPTAYISKSSTVGCGTIVEPKAIVNTGAHVGMGCIISVGAIVDHNAEVGDYAHINAGAIVKAGCKVANGCRINAGEVVGKFSVPQADSNSEFAKEYKRQIGQEASFF